MYAQYPRFGYDLDDCGVTLSPVNTPNYCPECQRLSGKRIDFIVGDITWFECGTCGHVWKQPQSPPAKDDLGGAKRSGTAW
jgi:rubredoxin